MQETQLNYSSSFLINVPFKIPREEIEMKFHEKVFFRGHSCNHLCSDHSNLDFDQNIPFTIYIRSQLGCWLKIKNCQYQLLTTKSVVKATFFPFRGYHAALTNTFAKTDRKHITLGLFFSQPIAN